MPIHYITLQQAPIFKVGDKVWLDLTHVHTIMSSKKLDTNYAKFTVVRFLSSCALQLDTRPGIHPVFHPNNFKAAARDPLITKRVSDAQLEPEIRGEDVEFEVDLVFNEKLTRPARGWQKHLLLSQVDRLPTA